MQNSGLKKVSPKTIVIACSIIILNGLFLHSLKAQNLAVSELKNLFDKKRFFEMRDKLKAFENNASGEILFFKGAVENKFNKPDESIRLLKKFLEHKPQNEELVRESHSLLADNFVKTYRYRQAAETLKIILQKFGGTLDEEKKADYQNVIKLWGALGKVPPQKTIFKGDSVIQGEKTIGFHIPVEINGKTESMIFDTGANLSTVTETLAGKLNLQIIEVQFDVTSITGEKIKAKAAVAEELKLGNVVVKNVVFIVFPDKALYIEPIKYQISGILGFPVIESLREITWTEDKKILIPQKARKTGQQNLAIDGLTPLISGIFNEKLLTFAFDTGADDSSLYLPFYKDFEKEILKNGESFMEKVTGVGGTKEVKAYLLQNLEMNFSGRRAVFPKIEVLTENTSDSSKYFYGNIGRDLIEQFDKMTLNFETMNISFESAANNCSDEHFKEFDFWLGDWEIEQKILKADGTWFESKAKNKVSKILEGCAVQENWEGEVFFFWEEMSQPEKIKALSVRSFDAKSRKWTINWMDTRSPKFSVFEGNFADGKGEFFRSLKDENGNETILRITFSDIQPGSVHWDLAFSKDGRKTFSTLWIMEMKRK
ncbi:MAG: retropepsin-like aspartic protease [Pyrinomonadaceae bacterium]